jgi:hypothetical protein
VLVGQHHRQTAFSGGKGFGPLECRVWQALTIIGMCGKYRLLVEWDNFHLGVVCIGMGMNRSDLICSFFISSILILIVIILLGVSIQVFADGLDEEGIVWHCTALHCTAK